MLAADISSAMDSWGLLSGHGGVCTCPICTGKGLDNIPLPAEIGTSGSAQAPLSGLSQAPLTSLPQLHSLASASAKLFLDFDGRLEASWGGRTNLTTPAFDQDGDPTTFSAGELAAINEIWARVAEDYSPFNIDVTTVDPGNETNGVTAVIAIGGRYSDWYGTAAGGVAFVGGFYNMSSNVGYVFSASLGGDAKNTSEATAHEAGHLFGLQHQASWSGNTLVTEYNSGNGSWAPIMGVGYSATRTTWYNGPTAASPTDYQDDMSILAGSSNGFGYRPDDFGGTIATAASLPTTGTSVNFNGLLGQADDWDVWSFATTGGIVTFQLTGAQYGTDLDAVLDLRNSSGATIISDAPSNSLGASLTTTLGAGTYYLVARGMGDYGDVGQYTITGSLPAPPASPPEVQFAVTSFSANEDDGTTNVVSLSRSGDLSVPTQVEVALTGGTATPDSDYSAADFPLIVSFAAGEASRSVPVTLTSDTLVEGLQTVLFQVTPVDNAVIGPVSSTTLNITDGDSATVAFQQVATAVGEDDPATALVLVLSTAPGNTLENDATTTVSATNGSAENADYDSEAFPKTVTFTAGQGNGATQTVSFVPSSDTLIEGDETVTLAITNGPLLTGSGQVSNLVTIRDADNATVAFHQAATTIGEDDPDTALVLVLSTAQGNTLENDATITVSATNGSAESTDYNSTDFPKTVTFTAGQGNGATQTVSFTPASDALIEGDETVTLNLANGSLLTGSGQTSQLVTIRDADSATVAFQQAATTVGEDDLATALVLVLSTAPGNTLESGATITVSATNGSAESTDYNSADFPKTVTFTAGQGNGATQTVSFAPASDALIEGDETVTLNLANGSLLTGSGQTSHLVTIRDADSATVVVVSGQSVAEDGGAQGITVRLLTSGGNTLEAPLTVTLSASASVGIEAADATFGTLGSFSFAAGAGNNATSSAVSFVPNSDSLVEGTEAALLSPSGTTLSGQVTYTASDVTILDADSATVAFQQATATVNEDDPATPLVLVLATAPGNTLENDATIVVNATNGSAENADYDSGAFPKTVTFTAGQGNDATQSVSLDPASDTLIEGNETVTLAISNGPLLSGSGQISDQITIRDANHATASFEQAATIIGEDDPATALVVVLTTTPGNTLEDGATITINAVNGSAENSDYDFGAYPKTVTFTAGQGNGATQTVSFDPASDTLVEGDETVTLALAAGPLLTGSGQVTNLVTIRDADLATVAWQAASSTAGEDAPAAALTLVLSTAPGNTLENGATVTINATNGSAESTDYDAGAFPKTVTFTAGQGNGATQSVSFDPASDTLIEGDETVTLNIGNGSLLTDSGQTSQLVTIRDADSATVAFQQAATTVGEEDPATALVLVLSTAPGNTLENNATVTVTAANGSATNADYNSAAFPQTVTFTAGQGNGAAQTVNFAPTSDTLVEGDETVTLTIISGPLLTGGSPLSQVVTIQDADSGTTVEFAATSFSANENDGTTNAVSLSRSGDLSVPTQVQVSLAGGTATPGSDYSAAGFPLIVSFAAGEASRSVPLSLVNDTLIEGLQTVLFQVTPLDNAVIGLRSSTTLNITDGDSATVAFQQAATTVGEDDPATALVLVLSTAPGNTLESGATITVSATNGSAENADYNSEAFPRTVTFTAGQGNGATQTVSFAPSSDALIEGDETVTLAITSGPLLSGSGQTSHLITIHDADSATVAFQQAATTVGEDDLATALVLVLSTAPGNTLESGATITVIATNGSAENADYDSAAFPKTVTFTAGQGNGATQTVSFDPASDALIEGDETVTLFLTNGSLLAASGQTSQLVTIKDADRATVIVVPGQFVTEDGGPQGIAVRLLTTDGSTLESDLTVGLSASASAETEAADATFGLLGSFTFAAGAGNNALSTAVNFVPNPDNLVEGSESALLAPAGSSLNNQISYASNEVTILDGDSATVSFQSASSTIGEEDPAESLQLILTTAPGNTLENTATITINATNGSAENEDYDSRVFAQSVTFAAGQGDGAVQSVSFDPTNDSLVEGDETVTLSISSGFLLTDEGQTTHEVTIVDGAVITDEDLPVNIALAAGELNAAQPNYQMVAWPQFGTLSGTLPNLIYSPRADYNGNDFFTVKVNDGLPNANEARIRLIVRPVNDEPIFAMATEVSVTDESPAQAIAGWAYNIAPGPADATDEAGQALAFAVSDDNAALFQERPTIDADGTLKFIPNPNVDGLAHVTVRLTDDGGTTSGGLDTAVASFTIYVAKAHIWHNARISWDVNDDGSVVADDVLRTINFLNASGSQRVPSIKTAAGPYYDVTGDGWVAADDALSIINHLNSLGPGNSLIGAVNGEGGSLAAVTGRSSEANLPLDELIALIASDVAESSKRRR